MISNSWQCAVYRRQLQTVNCTLLLVTFIENAFEYGISNHQTTYILIKLTTGNPGIHFYCCNKVIAITRQLKRAGIKIADMRQRLQHLFPKNIHLV
jgi:two-component system LytT family sensor kinase